MTLTAGQVRALLASSDHAPSRALGQNFVIDPNTVRRVARLAGVGPGDRVVEVGAGVGSLTLALAETGAEVTAVEVDRHLLPLLRQVVEPAGVRVVAGDAIRLDWDEVLGAGDPRGRPWVLAANLPYNIATPLIAGLLDDVPVIVKMTVMVQREVADRLVAVPGSRAYGAVSVKVAYWATARLVGTVPATVFLPRPQVSSGLVVIERRPRPAVDPATVSSARLFELVRAGFAHRRKMLRSTLGGLVPESAWATAGVAPEARPEELDVEAWGRLAAAS